MNDDTYEGILNQDDTQDFFNGDDARPFYPERAETIVTHTSRARTHYDGCHRVHPECALVKVAELEKERDELKNILRTGENLGWSAAYRGALSRAERLEAERDAANERAAQFEADARELAVASNNYIRIVESLAYVGGYSRSSNTPDPKHTAMAILKNEVQQHGAKYLEPKP